MTQLRLYQLQEIINKHLVADKATHVKTQQILDELKAELQKDDGNKTKK